ncbi:MAG: F0F1 ATP synthase subunit B [Candidatus Sungbacteria bacterium]|nr:F0F1 ATP synthase subunit B [Candidatus Sungbacteria bacterium]
MSELIHNFGIDWKLLAAQAVNFFVLLIILKKFAYGPVLTILRQRRERIEQGISDAEAAGEKLRESEQEKEQILKTAHVEALSIVNTAEETAKKHGEEIIVHANKKVETVVADAKRLIEEEKSKMGDDVLRGGRELVRLGIVKVLGKLPAAERDEVLIEEALKELKTINVRR